MAICGSEMNSELAAGGGEIGRGELLAIFLHQLRAACGRIVGVLDLSAMQDVDRALAAHDRDLGVRPGVHEVGPHLLAAHREIGPAIGLAEDDRELGDGGAGVREQHLGTVPDDPAALLFDPGQEARDVDQRHQRDVEAIAEPDEPRALVGGVDVEGAGNVEGIVGDQADDHALDTGESDDEILGEPGVDLQEPGIVDEPTDHGAHIHGRRRVVGDEVVHLSSRPSARSGRMSWGGSSLLLAGRNDRSSATRRIAS